MPALWPNTEAVIGVYDHPPPEDSGIDYVLLPAEVTDDQLWSREAVKTALALTSLKDRVRGWF